MRKREVALAASYSSIEILIFRLGRSCTCPWPGRAIPRRIDGFPPFGNIWWKVSAGHENKVSGLGLHRIVFSSFNYPIDLSLQDHPPLVVVMAVVVVNGSRILADDDSPDMVERDDVPIPIRAVPSPF